MATHSSILAWRIPRTEEPGGLQFMGSHRVGRKIYIANLFNSVNLSWYLSWAALNLKINWEEVTFYMSGPRVWGCHPTSSHRLALLCQRVFFIFTFNFYWNIIFFTTLCSRVY